MKKKNTFLSVVLAIVLTAAFILTVASCVLSFAVGNLRTTLMDYDYYEKVVCTDSYGDELKGRVDKELEADCRIYGIPYDAIRDSIGKDDLTDLAVKHAKAFVNGEPTDGLVFPTEKLKAATRAYGAGEGKDSIFADEENVGLLAEKITGRIDGTFLTVTEQPLVQKACTAVLTNPTVRRVCDAFPILLAAALISLIIVFASKKGGFPSRMYAASSALFVSASLCFAPSLLLKLGDIQSRVAISDSYVRQFFLAIVNGLTDRLFSVSLVMFAVSAVLLITSSVLIVAAKKRKNIEK